MIDLKDKLAALPIFKGLHGDELAILAGGLQWLSVPGGWTIFSEDDQGDGMFVVLSGRLGVFKRNVEGNSELIAQIGPGETVGEMALLSDERRSATIVALRDSELVGLNKETFEDVAGRYPQVMRTIARLVVTRLRNMLGRCPLDEAPSTIALLPLSPAVPAAANRD